MKSKTIKSIIATIILLASCLGCSNPYLHDRPSEESCKLWLTGQKVFVDKGIIFDDFWTIESNEFEDFDQLTIQKNPDGTSTMEVCINLAGGEQKLRVYGTIVYRFIKEEHATLFISFTPSRVLKMGKW